ncbi:MAG: ferredoxin [Pseudonocardia sp.]|nr:ferredoxin [Pseudonocardia sp.]
MKAHIDLDKCEGYANCVLNADRVFDIDDGTGQAVVLMAEIPVELSEEVQLAEMSCPARAILLDE